MTPTGGDIRAALLLEGLDDMLNLGWIEQTIGYLRGKEERETPEIVESTSAAIRDLIDAGYAIAGNVVKDPADGLLMVKSWNLSPKGTIERIEQERGELDEDARRYLVWLELTAKGREEARRLDASGCDPFKK